MILFAKCISWQSPPWSSWNWPENVKATHTPCLLWRVHLFRQSETGREKCAELVLVDGKVTEISYRIVMGREPLDGNEQPLFAEVVAGYAEAVTEIFATSCISASSFLTLSSRHEK